MQNIKTGSEIRQEFIDFFLAKGHKFVPSSSLIPGGDQTLLFTNAGMVQFKDIFLGIDKRDYSRAVNSQKCMRVAGKHNDLEDVGRDDYHHTFFEMLGNWSFGDYYKKEAITWAWELLTDVWKLDKGRLWVTCFKDEKKEIETDQEAANEWNLQDGLPQDHILFFGRKENFWEMADVGPCGPCSEIHYDRGIEFCDKKNSPNHQCMVNGDCNRFLELWNLVFIQYNRLSPDKLESLPSKHVDTGMGFERIVSVLQGVDSNYKTDVLMPLMDEVLSLCADTIEQREKNLTPYRVIADHARAATFLISDGVVPGNIGRNYICRMIIRRAARFGSKLGLSKPFLGQIALKVIDIYKSAYKELEKNRSIIVENITREEERYHSTVETGMAYLEEQIQDLEKSNKNKLPGTVAFELYATHGLPLEIIKDVLVERGFSVNEEEFHKSMETHRVNSGAGQEMGSLGGEDAEFFSDLAQVLKSEKKLRASGVEYDPYTLFITDADLIAIVKEDNLENKIKENEQGKLIIDRTGFYIESGGQVSDTGYILSKDGKNRFLVEDVRKPAPGIIVHYGKMISGSFQVGNKLEAKIDMKRRRDIMRNHTATHLLHAQLRDILGHHVRQAGSLVAADRLRFDFTHPKAISQDELIAIEEGINQKIINNFELKVENKKLQEALDEGAMALFGEKYGEEVRTISIGDQKKFSFELCGGTHVHETAEIGYFIIISEGSVAAGVRRIEAVTGRKAFKMLADQTKTVRHASRLLECNQTEIIQKLENAIDRNNNLFKEIREYQKKLAQYAYEESKEKIVIVDNNRVLTMVFENHEIESLRNLADQFRNEYSSGIAVFANIKNDDRIEIITTVTDDLIKIGYHAGRIAQKIAEAAGGGGGGKPHLAQAGGKDKQKLLNALKEISSFVK